MTALATYIPDTGAGVPVVAGLDEDTAGVARFAGLVRVSARADACTCPHDCDRDHPNE
jgi:hypothetical protein